MANGIADEASEKAGLVSKYIAVLLGNFCAISAIYFAVRNEFVMPQTAQVLGIWFAVWVVAVLILHSVVKPWLEKRYIRKLSSGDAK
ncbi:MAG: hypothetical protein ACR2O3_12660 [Rhizobiaceae bacterium]